VPRDQAFPIGAQACRSRRWHHYAFSTAPGATTEDGLGDHSRFAEALLAHLGDKGLEYGSVHEVGANGGLRSTLARQLPYIEDALPALFLTGTQTGQLPERDQLLLAMTKIDADMRAQVERIAKAKDVQLAPLHGSLVGSAALLDKDDEARQKLLRKLLTTSSRFEPTSRHWHDCRSTARRRPCWPRAFQRTMARIRRSSNTWQRHR
jgi:hypothetical protein